MISLIAAMDKNRVIGAGNKLPWHLPADLKFFKETTLGHPVIMGRKTFDSVGRPLPGRRNIVITRQKGYAAEGVTVVNALEEALKLVEGEQEAFIVGGAEIYRQSLEHADRIYLTEIDTAVEHGDAHFPELNPAEWELCEKRSFQPDAKNKFAYTFLTYTRKRS